MKLSWIWLVLLLALTGCGFFGGGEPEPEPREPVTLTLISIGVNGETEQALIDAYRAEHPWVTVEVHGYNQLPQDYLLSDTPPDIMAMAPSYILDSAASQGLVADITDVWAQSGLLDRYPAGFRALSEIDGKQYFLPVTFRWIGIYYNRTIFDNLGLVPPQTWDEFMQVCDTLLAQGETPLALAGNSPFDLTLWFDYLNLRLNGPEFHQQLTRGQISYQDDRVRTVFELWQNLFDRDYVVERSANMDPLSSLTALVRTENGALSGQKAVMVLASPYALQELPIKLQEDLGLFRFPIIDPSLPVGEVLPSLGYMIPAKAAHAPDAIELLTWLASGNARATIIAPRTSGVPWLPVNASAADDTLDANLAAGATLVEGADVVMQQYYLNMPLSLQPRIERALQTFIRSIESGASDVAGVQSQLEEIRQSALADGLLSE